MMANLKVNDTIATKAGPAKIIRIGEAWPSEKNPHRWAMMTLELDSTGTTVYAAARADELHPDHQKHPEHHQ